MIKNTNDSSLHEIVVRYLNINMGRSGDTAKLRKKGFSSICQFPISLNDCCEDSLVPAINSRITN